MKKTITLLASLFLYFNFCAAQISSLPYTEGFENPFAQGANIDFTPNFNGNIVASTNRIFQDASVHYAGAASCAIVPTSSFEGIVLIKMNLTGYSNVFMNFWACSALNGTGTRPALVEISASIDNGVNYSPSSLIGDSVIFANGNTSWNNYEYYLPYITNNNPNVQLMIRVSRGDGTGTTARWLMDEVTFNFSATDVNPPYVLDAYASSLNQIKVAYSEPVNSTANNTNNYTGISNLGSTTNSAANDTIIIDVTSPLTQGQWYYFNISNVQDAAGNSMTVAQDFIVTYNDNTGNIKITEINYDNPGSDSLSFVELKNMDSQPINVGGWQFTKGLSGFFPSEYILQPGAYIVFSQFPTVVNSFFNILSFQISGSLNNSGENVAVFNSEHILIDSVSYSSLAPWDTMANGYGPSLVFCDESTDNDQPSNWSIANNFAGMYLGTDSIFANPMNNCTLTTGIEDFSNTKLLSAFPNPVNDLLTIHYEINNLKDDSWEIFDFSGRKIKLGVATQSNNQNEIQISFKEFHTGIYFIKTGLGILKITKVE